MDIQIAKSFDIILDMLRYRGESVPDISSSMIFEFIKQQVSKTAFQIDINAMYKIVYQISPKPLWKDIQFILNTKPEKESPFYFIITIDHVSPNDSKKLDGMNITYQTFLLKELQYDITKHVLVPKHEIVKDTQDIQHIMDELSLPDLSKLPFILKTDPVARFIHAQPGDIIRITRNSPTSGVYISYRYCV